MFCQNCRTEIPPAWVASISKNECPACGQEIMNAAGRELLAELTEAMTKMENNPAGLAGWLLSNYQLRKVGTGEPTEFFGTKSVKENLKIAENPVHKFLSRKNPHLAKQPKMKELVKHIQESSEEDFENEYEGEDEYEENNFPAGSMKAALANNTVMDSGPPLSQQDLEEMQAVFASSNVDLDDLASLPPALRTDRLKRLQERQNLNAGGSVGLIKRSE